MNSVTILGKGPSRIKCQFDTDEIWGINDVGDFDDMKGKRIDKIGCFHPLTEASIRAMRRIAPIISWQDYADIKYPLEEIIKKFNTDYLANGIAYMIALAIHEKIPLIKMRGVDATHGANYMIERPCVEYWKGRADQSGIEVDVGEWSHIGRTPSGHIYGQLDGATARLSLAERWELLKLLPFRGTYETILLSGSARHAISIREHEGKEHDIEIFQTPTGALDYRAREEFITDIRLYPKAWQYIKDTLQSIEQRGELPISAQSVYEKFVGA